MQINGILIRSFITGGARHQRSNISFLHLFAFHSIAAIVLKRYILLADYCRKTNFRFLKEVGFFLPEKLIFKII